MMKLGFIRMNPKITNSPEFGYFKPTEVVRSRSAAKQIIACFFGVTGHVAIKGLED